MASRILGMGDVLSLIELAEESFDLEETARMEKRLRKGKFDLEDFLKQLRQVRKMGSIGELLNMVPGMKRALRGVSIDEAQTEKQLKRVEAIILSMTPEERRNPSVLNGSRRLRIAQGSGTEVQEINQLISQYRQMKKMVKNLNKGKMGRGLSLPKFF